MKRSIFLVFCFLTSGILAGQPSPSNLKVNYLSNPLGIDSKAYFSWEMSNRERSVFQKAWQILVSADEKSLKDNKGIVWDSGKKMSDVTFQIPFDGQDLQPGTRYYWKVRIWDEHENVSSYSEPGWFETGLLKESDWKGEWIGDGKLPPEKTGRFLQKNTCSVVS
jgi:alpha-L-rhamnosidase